jgi:hypothetical protein
VIAGTLAADRIQANTITVDRIISGEVTQVQQSNRDGWTASVSEETIITLSSITTNRVIAASFPILVRLTFSGGTATSFTLRIRNSAGTLVREIVVPAVANGVFAYTPVVAASNLGSGNQQFRLAIAGANVTTGYAEFAVVAPRA